jgi:DNA-binding NarL/FixJ family response regulator
MMQPLKTSALEAPLELTTREMEVVRMIANGLRNRQIGDLLLISEGTVKAHLHSIYRKLGLNSRVTLALLARERGFV